MGMDYPKAIKEYREKHFLSQTDLGNILGVSYVTVNRWENGHFEPTKIVKVRLEEILKENNIVLKEVDE